MCWKPKKFETRYLVSYDEKRTLARPTESLVPPVLFPNSARQIDRRAWRPAVQQVEFSLFDSQWLWTNIKIRPSSNKNSAAAKKMKRLRATRFS